MRASEKQKKDALLLEKTLLKQKMKDEIEAKAAMLSLSQNSANSNVVAVEPQKDSE